MTTEFLAVTTFLSSSFQSLTVRCFYSVSIHHMAPPERSGAHPITAHYSFIDPERVKGGVGLVV